MKNINEIMNTLEEQKKLYEKALELSEKRNDALAKDKDKELQVILREEENLSKKIKEKEEKRISLIGDPDKKLIDIINIISDKEVKDKLNGQRDDLQLLINKIKDSNEMSRKLIKITNGLLDRLIEKVTGKKEIGYNKNKTKQNLSKTTLLNKKV